MTINCLIYGRHMRDMGRILLRNGGTFVAVLMCAGLIGCRVHFDVEKSYRWHELSPPPIADAIARFRTNFPTTPVTTTQPNTWNKIEIGMTRGMVRALVGDRLDDRRKSQPAVLQQGPPAYERWWVRLYFDDSHATPSDDVLEAIIVRRTIDRPIRSTDWP